MEVKLSFKLSALSRRTERKTRHGLSHEVRFPEEEGHKEARAHSVTCEGREDNQKGACLEPGSREREGEGVLRRSFYKGA